MHYLTLCNPNNIRHFISTGLGNLLSKDARNLNTFSYFRLNFDNNQVQPSLNIFLLYSIEILKRNFLTISLNLCKKKKQNLQDFLFFIKSFLRKIFIFESTINHFQSNNLYRQHKEHANNTRKQKKNYIPTSNKTPSSVLLINKISINDSSCN